MLGLDERPNGMNTDQCEKLKRLIEKSNDVFALVSWGVLMYCDK